MFDVLKWLAESDLPRSEIKVENLICTPVITVNTGSTIEEAFDIMKKFDITSLAVTEKGKLKGYITDKGVKEWMNMYPHYLRYVQATKQSKCSELIEEIFRSGSPTS
jgi:predicted transcriptional regulator